MMRKSKWNHMARFAAGWVAAAVLLLQTACGGGEEAATPAASAPASAAQPPAAAQSAVVDGEMWANVNGERRKWYITHIERDGDWQSGSFWRPSAMKSVQVSLFGLTDQGAMPTGKGDIQLNFLIPDPGAKTTTTMVTFNLFADGRTKTWTSDELGEAVIMLNRTEFEGEYLELGGSFSGKVVLPDLGNAATETSQPREFELKDGVFSVRVREFQR